MVVAWSETEYGICYLNGPIGANVMETLLSASMGIGLSAACGFRVFVPLLVMSIAAKTGYLTPAPGFEWIAAYSALITFATATALEIAGYYIPWVDNMLDAIATPAAVIAGSVAMASMVTGMSPFLKWTLVVIAGGGTAGLVQVATSVTRAASTGITGGLGNSIVSTTEAAGSIVLSVLAVLVPFLALAAVLAIFFFALKKLLGKLYKERAA